MEEFGELVYVPPYCVGGYVRHKPERRPPPLPERIFRARRGDYVDRIFRPTRGDYAERIFRI